MREKCIAEINKRKRGKKDGKRLSTVTAMVASTRFKVAFESIVVEEGVVVKSWKLLICHEMGHRISQKFIVENTTTFTQGEELRHT